MRRCEVLVDKFLTSPQPRSNLLTIPRPQIQHLPAPTLVRQAPLPANLRVLCPIDGHSIRPHPLRWSFLFLRTWDEATSSNHLIPIGRNARPILDAKHLPATTQHAADALCTPKAWNLARVEAYITRTRNGPLRPIPSVVFGPETPRNGQKMLRATDRRRCQHATATARQGR